MISVEVDLIGAQMFESERGKTSNLTVILLHNLQQSYVRMRGGETHRGRRQNVSERSLNQEKPAEQTNKNHLETTVTTEDVPGVN